MELDLNRTWVMAVEVIGMERSGRGEGEDESAGRVRKLVRKRVDRRDEGGDSVARTVLLLALVLVLVLDKLDREEDEAGDVKIVPSPDGLKRDALAPEDDETMGMADDELAGMILDV